MPDFTIYGYGDKFSGDDILFKEQKRSDSKAIYQCLLKKPLVSYKSVDAFNLTPIFNNNSSPASSSSLPSNTYTGIIKE